MSSTGSSTALRFACACGQVQGSANVPSSNLPLSFEVCHCDSCRHQTGLLGASYVGLPDETTDIQFTGPLKHYRSSKHVTRSFCSNCGANICVQEPRQSKPEICTGILKKVDGLIRLSEHIFVPDSRDGGLSNWIPDVPMYEGFPEGERWYGGESKETRIDEQGSSELEVYCHCRGVQLKIRKPGSHTPGEEAGWWLRASGTKYLAGTCACQSCRLNSGFDIQTWAFVKKENIRQINGDALDYGMGTLAQYDSSPGVHRHFCANCGATVFWRNESRRPDIIDVSVGLLNAREGNLADSWLEWRTHMVSFEEEAQNKDLVERLSAGLKHWGASKYSRKEQGCTLLN